MLEDICCDIFAISKDEVGRIWKSAPLHAVQDTECHNTPMYGRLALSAYGYDLQDVWTTFWAYMDKETCGHSE